MVTETKTETTARMYPEATRIVRESQVAGSEKPSTTDAEALIAVWRDPEHHTETLGHALARTIDLWPKIKSSEGRVKWQDYPLLAALGDQWKENGCKSYAITMADGTIAQRVLFDMSEIQRLKEVLPRIRLQREALTQAEVDLLAFNRQMRKMKCPPSLAPSEYFQKTIDFEEHKAERTRRATAKRDRRVTQPAE